MEFEVSTRDPPAVQSNAHELFSICCFVFGGHIVPSSHMTHQLNCLIHTVRKKILKIPAYVWTFCMTYNKLWYNSRTIRELISKWLGTALGVKRFLEVVRDTRNHQLHYIAVHASVRLRPRAEAKIIWPKHAAGCPALLLTQVHNIKFSPSIKQPQRVLPFKLAILLVLCSGRRVSCDQ